MSLDLSTAFTPAVILKPLPDAEARGDEPVRIGGAPQLPEGQDWPRSKGGVPFHFYAQIDLSAAPKALETDVQTYAFPDMPRHGTLFIFLMLETDVFYDVSVPQAVIHVPMDVRDLPEVMPPEDTPSLEDFYFGDDSFGAYSDCKRMLRKQFAALVPYLSTQGEAPIWFNMEREEGDQEERQALSALQTHSLAEVLGTPELLPDLGVAPEGFDAPWLKKLPLAFRPDYKLRDKRLTWEEIYDWGKDILMEWIRYLERAIENDLRAARRGHETSAPEGEDVEAVAQALEASWSRLNWAWRKPKWSKCWTPLTLLLWPKSVPVDRKLAALLWAAKHAVGPVPPFARARFFAIIKEIDALAQTEQHVPLMTMEKGDWPYVSSVELRDRAIERLRVLRPRRTAPEPQPDPPTTWDEKVRQETMMPYPSRHNFSVSGESRVPIQMFGAGFLLQHAALERADDILLLQLGEPFGTGISFMGDALLQLWIKPEDLAAARFGGVEATFEAT